MNNIGGIYQIQSKCKPERVYVGSSVNITKRWKEHINDLKANRHKNIKIQRHYDKYSLEDLEFSVLVECDNGKLLELEQYFIDSYNPYFNVCKIAGNTLGYKFSQEVIDKIKESRKWYVPTAETRAKTSAFMRGNQYGLGVIKSEETRQKISAATSGENNPNYGKTHSEETRVKMSEKAKGRVISEETREKLREANSGENNGFYGKKHSEETKQKIREKRTGTKMSDEYKKKQSERNKKDGRWVGESNPMYGVHKSGKDSPSFGRVVSEEEKARVAAGRKPMTEESRLKRSAASRNRKHTEEDLAKMRIAQKAAWVIRRLKMAKKEEEDVIPAE